MLVMNHVSSGSGEYDECDINWYIDSGCSNHMSYNENVFENLHAPTEFSYMYKWVIIRSIALNM